MVLFQPSSVFSSGMRGAKNRHLAVVLIFLVSLVVYFNALWNGFASDDYDIIVNYPLIQDFRNIPAFFSAEDTLANGDPTGYYRPLARMSYTLDYQLWGLNPFGYHLINVLLHASTAVTFFLLLCLLFPLRVAFVSALLFALHPIHVEAVTWITGRNNVLSGLFLLLSFYYYVRFDRENRAMRRTLYFLWMLLYLALSLLSKEFALMFPFLLFLYHLCLSEQEGPPQIERQIFSRASAANLAVFLVIGLYLYARHRVVGSSMNIHVPQLTYNAALSLKNYYTYLQTHLLPINLSTTSFIPSHEPFLNARGVLSIITLITVTVASCYFYRKDRPLLFATIFFVIFLLPVSNIIAFNQVPVAERYAYIASMGFCLFCALLLDRLLPKYKRIAYPFLIVTSIFYSYQTINRNLDWRDNLTLFRKTVETLPDSPVAHYSLGNAYLEKGMVPEAVSSFRKSMALNANFPHSRLALAKVYQDEGMWDTAEQLYREVIHLMPDNTDARENLAFVLFQQGMLDEAIKELQEVLLKKPAATNARENLNLLILEKKLTQQGG